MGSSPTCNIAFSPNKHCAGEARRTPATSIACHAFLAKNALNSRPSHQDGKLGEARLLLPFRVHWIRGPHAAQDFPEQ